MQFILKCTIPYMKNYEFYKNSRVKNKVRQKIVFLKLNVQIWLKWILKDTSFPCATQFQYLDRSHHWYFISETGQYNFNIHVTLNQSFDTLKCAIHWAFKKCNVLCLYKCTQIYNM